MIGDAPGGDDRQHDEQRGLRDRLSSQAEERIGKLADDLLENRVINSTGRTLPGLMRGRPYNPAFMHPDDLADLGVVPGELVEIRSEYATITGVAEADADLRRGVVSMSHNFGGNPGEDEDPRVDGANTNRLLRTDVEFDRYTGIPRMGALPVAVVPVAGDH